MQKQTTICLYHAYILCHYSNLLYTKLAFSDTSVFPLNINWQHNLSLTHINMPLQIQDCSLYSLPCTRLATSITNKQLQPFTTFVSLKLQLGKQYDCLFPTNYMNSDIYSYTVRTHWNITVLSICVQDCIQKQNTHGLAGKMEGGEGWCECILVSFGCFWGISSVHALEDVLYLST